MTNIKTVTPKELDQWLEADEAVLIDVREVPEYQKHHIKEAINLPLSDVCLDHKHMPNHEGKRLVFQCKMGGRSQKACAKIMAERTGMTVWNLEGGIEGWMAVNLPVNSR